MELPFEDLLSTLSGKRFSTLAESPDVLLHTALAFEYVMAVMHEDLYAYVQCAGASRGASAVLRSNARAARLTHF